MREACASCGQDFLQEQGYYVGAMYLNYLMTAALGLTTALLLVERVPLTRLIPALAAFALVFPLLTYRWSKALWLGIQRYIEEGTTEESGIQNPESRRRPPTPGGSKSL
jgi:hypothetical protein